MKRGTYAEALAAGFNETQAGFMARMSGETCDEAVEVVKEEFVTAVNTLQPRRTKVAFFVGGTTLAITAGFFAGAPLTFGLLFLIGYGLGHAAR